MTFGDPLAPPSGEVLLNCSVNQPQLNCDIATMMVCFLLCMVLILFQIMQLSLRVIYFFF